MCFHDLMVLSETETIGGYCRVLGSLLSGDGLAKQGKRLADLAATGP